MKRLLSLLILAICLMATLPLSAEAAEPWDGVNATQPIRGNGYDYQVGTGAELAWIAQNMDKSYVWGATIKLTDDIDLGEHPWTPILGFRGTFDGGGRHITGLNVEDSINAGLFGIITSPAVIQNVTVSGTATGRGYVGGVVADNQGGLISNVTSHVAVQGESSGTIGGVVGFNEGGMVIHCTATGTVRGGGISGGVVGHNWRYSDNRLGTFGVVAGCVYSGEGVVGADGTVENITSYISHITVGGVVGRNIGTVVACYNTGSVTAPEYVTGGITLYGTAGGIIGLNIIEETAAGTDATLWGGYNTGAVSGDPSRTGGIIGENISGTVTDAFYLDGVAERGVGSGTAAGSSFTTAAVTSSGESLLLALNEGIEAYRQDRGENALDIDNYIVGDPYPKIPPLPPLTSWVEDAVVVEPPLINDAYEIDTAEELAWFNKNYRNNSVPDLHNANIRLTGNIDLSEHKWVTIFGTFGYQGTFDGGGHTISGLYSIGGGLFNTINDGGIVKNLNVLGSVQSGGYVGGVANEVQTGGRLDNVSFIGDVTGTWSFRNVGGIAGLNRGTITGARFFGEVNFVKENGDDVNVGGLVGRNYGLLINSANTGGSVNLTENTDSSTVGGAVGYNNGDIVNVYNKSIVSSASTDDFPGGVVGINATDGQVNNVYNIGTLNGAQTSGVVYANNGDVENAYWLSSVANNGIGTGSGTSSNVVSFTQDGTISASVGGTTYNTLLSALNAGVAKYNTDNPSGEQAIPWSETIDFPTLFAVKGDSNGNGIVDVADLIAVASPVTYNKKAGDVGYNAALDANGDNKINFADLAYMRNSKVFGK